VKCRTKYCRDVERRLREKSRGIVLKPYLSGKSDVWKNFSLVFEQRHDVHGSASVEKLVELKYLCHVRVTITYSSSATM